MGLILPFRPNRLVYPGGNPGFNSSHIAAGATGTGTSAAGLGMCFSAVPAVGTSGVVNLFNGAQPTYSGGFQAAAMDSSLGPAVNCTSGSVHITFPVSGFLAQTVTIGTIIRFNAVGGSYQGMAGWAGASNGFYIFNGQIDMFGSWGDVLSGFTLSAGVPYFVAVSALGTSSSSSFANFVAVNLNNGQTKTTFVTGFTMSSSGLDSGSTINFGNDGGTLVANARVAALMVSQGFLSAGQLMQWAQDPWSFWYPDQAKALVVASVTPSPPPPSFHDCVTLMGIS